MTSPQLDSLHGLRVGDALGAQFFVPGTVFGIDPPAPWPWTDDTEMACSVHAALTERDTGRIDLDIDTFDLTHAFARRHDFDRGYGPAANRMLRLIREGGDARALAAGLFDGQGSYGNGAAMRVAPLGAAFAADPAAAVRPATDSALITHTHPQAVDGAVAVAVAAAYAVRARTAPVAPADFLAAVRALTPRGALHEALGEARALLGEPDPVAAARILGNGSRVSALDTVPFALWCAARSLDDYRGAVLAAIRAGGDVDTTAAIVGGVVAARTGTAGIPGAWLAAAEALPDWALPRAGTVAGPPEGGQPMLLPRRHPVPPELRWSDREWQRLRRGLTGRWASHSREGTLHLYRARTGYEILSVAVAPVRDGSWRPVEVLVETHPARFAGAQDEGFLAALLRRMPGCPTG
ncbi:ADP-ribosylglycohydrolase [Kitasatospora sp. MAA4]|uniref:ADP-ribosylglycohydrolase family protein n=1 Tax=Kitasatospora sp. MAA4 TaxID=3035093 RepID=UPI00247D05F2|nr:ADP-ribosylglycohydrolase [Kitasatospora sp. MAA4]